MSENIDVMVRTLIQTQVVQALNSAPDAVEAMVKAALLKPVDADTGRADGYGRKVSYLEWMTGDMIRIAAGEAVRKVLVERAVDIEAAVREALSQQTIVDGLTKLIVGTVEESWRIDVRFERDKS